jgi:hypothetical protein
MKGSKTKPDKLFWFLRNRGDDLDFVKDCHLIIHQTLALGSMEDVQKLFLKYGRDVIKEEFQKPVRGLYSPSVFHFFEHVLGVRIKKSEQYIKHIHPVK